MGNIKIVNSEGVFLNILARYANNCFEIYFDTNGAAYFIFNELVVCYNKLNSEKFTSPLRSTFTIKCTYELDEYNNSIEFNNIKEYRYLDKEDLIMFLCKIKSHTRIDFHGNPLDS